MVKFHALAPILFILCKNISIDFYVHKGSNLFLIGGKLPLFLCQTAPEPDRFRMQAHLFHPFSYCKPEFRWPVKADPLPVKNIHTLCFTHIFSISQPQGYNIIQTICMYLIVYIYGFLFLLLLEIVISPPLGFIS